LRIVGGRWAGVELTSPSGRVRPTAELLRDAWLTSLEDDLSGARVLDLFAGSGALGIEALSRGAASVDFVENGRSALHALKANIARVRAARVTRVFVKDALAFLGALDAGAYDVALADPPYTSDLAARTVQRWLEMPFSRVLGVEHAPGKSLPGRGKTRQVGEGALSIYRMRSWPPA
jgi:16S rRNA (guanine966-N2)-methyltransferase